MVEGEMGTQITLEQGTQEQKTRHHGFSIVPRLVMRHERFATLPESSKWLYACLRDICGEQGGECWYSLRNLKKLIHISASTISRGIDKLLKAGLILANKIGTKGREVFHIRIVDIWEENDTTYQDCFKMKQLGGTVSKCNTQTVATVSNRNAQFQNETVGDAVHAQDCFILTYKDINDSRIEESRKNDSSSAHADDSVRKKYEAGYSGLQDLPIDCEDQWDLIPPPSVHPDNHIASSSSGLYESQFSEGASDATTPRDNCMRTDRASGLSRARGEQAQEVSEEPEYRTQAPAAFADSVVSTTLQAGCTSSVTPTGGSTTSDAPLNSIAHGMNSDSLPPANVTNQSNKNKKPAEPSAKCDAKEVRQRINERRGYALEEQVEIIRENKAIKTWCHLHPIEDLEPVLDYLQYRDKFWSKPENRHRIGGLTLLKETPRVLAEIAMSRQHGRQPIPIRATSALPPPAPSLDELRAMPY